uniref:EG964 n=1 Tax=Rhizophora mucronata TaxID=61149 RepID=A0A2P2KBA2_RHIMU
MVSLARWWVGLRLMGLSQCWGNFNGVLSKAFERMTTRQA